MQRVYPFLVLSILLCFQSFSGLFGQVYSIQKTDGPFFNSMPFVVSYLQDYNDTAIFDLVLNDVDIVASEYAIFLGDAEVQQITIGDNKYYTGKYQNTKFLHHQWDNRHFIVSSDDLRKGPIIARCYNLSKKDFYLSPVIFDAQSLDKTIIDLIDHSKTGIFFTLLFLGAILIFLFYSIGMTIQTGNADFRYYGYYLLAILLHNLAQADAYLKIYMFFPENPIWYHYLNEFLQMFIYAFFILFIKVFLELKWKKSKFLPLVNFSILMAVVFSLTFLFVALLTRNFHIVQNYLSLLWLVIALLGAIIIIGVYRETDSAVKNYILIGALLLMAGSILELFTSLGLEGGYNWNVYAEPVFGWNPFNYTQLAILGEIVCFALGIGKKMSLKDNELRALQKREIKDLKSREELQAIQRATLEKELYALRSQMNPHFLFNSMSSVNDYIMKENPKAASKYLTKFAKLMRGILNNSRKKDITLSEEIEMLNLYVELEQHRSAGSFTYECSIEPTMDVNQILIPSMMIQPYVENAIKHGLRERHYGQLKLSFHSIDERLYIQVEDNGIGRLASKERNASKKKTSHGMAITEDRIDLLNRIYDINAQVTIDDLEENGLALGTRVRIEMDIINKV